MEFKDWMQQSKEEIAQAVSHDNDKMNDRQKYLLPVFLQYKMLQKTHHLVIATWVLAILTVLINSAIIFVK